MYLLFGQLVYTSFAGRGFKTLASAHVPSEIQQAFMQRVVSQYWDSYNPPAAGYRAVYLHQLAPEQTLFGWLYNDGSDDIGRGNVPYFVCYYVTEPLFDFQLANIFTCLEKGPIALIDRHNPTAYLETQSVPNLWNYQPARAGVSIGLHTRQRSYFALREGELLELFVPVYEQETVIDLNGQTYEQQIANLSIYTRYVIDAIKLEPTLSSEDQSADIKTSAIQTYQSYKQKLQVYPSGKKNQRQSIIKGNSGNLLLKNKNNKLISAKLNRQSVTVNTNTYFKRQLPQVISNLNQNLTKSSNYESVLAYKNYKLLLKLGIAATVLALSFAIYGLQQTNVSKPNQREFAFLASNAKYQRLADVPNVPPGKFRYGGSTSFAPLRSQVVTRAIAQAHPQFKLLYTESKSNIQGSTIGIQMLLTRQLSFAQSSRPIKDAELKQAQQLGLSIAQIPIAIDGIAFYVNPQVDIPGLSISQIRDIFTGKITNWKQVGGPDLPITPFSLNPQLSGTADFLKEKVLQAEEFGLNVQNVDTTTNSIRLVAKTRGGIGYATASEVIGQKTIDPLSLATVNPLPLSITGNQNFVAPFNQGEQTAVNITAFANGSYPLTRNLFIIIRQNGGIDEQAGIAYTNLLFSEEGKQLLQKAGFVPMY